MKVPMCSVRARQFNRAVDLDVSNRTIPQSKASAPGTPASDTESRGLAEGGLHGQPQLRAQTGTAVSRVLVVDDAPAMRLLMEKTLHALGYQATTASNAAEALSRLSQEPIDVLLSDVQMPGLSGLELSKMAKARWPHLAIILLSPLISDPLQSGEGTEGVDLLLAKPVKMETLKEALQVMLKGRRPSSTTRRA